MADDDKTVTNHFITQSQLLTTLRAERAQWQALLASIGPEHMTQPGAAGEWSVKDVIAHINVYEHWLVDWLQAARRGEFPTPSVLDTPGTDARNTAAYELTRALSLAEVQAEATRNFQALLAVLEQFPAEDFTQPERTEWFMNPYWSQTRTIGEAVLNYTLEHYAEHTPSLRAWAQANH